MTDQQEFTYLPCAVIRVDTENRQRKEVKTGSLTDSVRRLGVLNPIIITKNLLLVAGERRLRASIEAGLTTIPVRYKEDLSPLDARRIELEENLKRADLHWRDEAKAISELHDDYSKSFEGWSQARTAKELGLDPSYITYAVRVVRDFNAPSIAHSASLSAAYNILSRKDSRAEGDAIAEIEQAGASFFNEPEPELQPPPGTEPSHISLSDTTALAPPPRPEDSTILHADFTQWAPAYTGPKFNFLHCDFPYGVNFNAGPMSGRDKWETYDDSPDIYWNLIETLCKNLDRLLAAEAHIMFWLAADIRIQSRTLDMFAKLAPSIAFSNYPLIWIKSDNVGVLPDAKRGPRRIYETAIYGAREDRLIVKPVSNAYQAPTDKLHHASTKPEPMLRQFFQMFVDESTRMLDPTCGSGAAIRAAESMGAKSALGLEISEEHCNNARSALRQFRNRQALGKFS